MKASTRKRLTARRRAVQKETRGNAIERAARWKKEFEERQKAAQTKLCSDPASRVDVVVTEPFFGGLMGSFIAGVDAMRSVLLDRIVTEEVDPSTPDPSTLSAVDVPEVWGGDAGEDIVDPPEEDPSAEYDPIVYDAIAKFGVPAELYLDKSPKPEEKVDTGSVGIPKTDAIVDDAVRRFGIHNIHLLRKGTSP